MRVSEAVVAVFFCWTTLLAAFMPLNSEMKVRVWAAAAVVVLVYALLFLGRSQWWTAYARDWVPQALMILAYKQMGWFAPETHSYGFEYQWVAWDRLILNTLHGREWIESLGRIIPSILELSYVLVYSLPPVTMLLLYALDMRDKADTLLTIYLLALFSCYAQFPFWPSEPPRSVFAGQDLPTLMTPFREFNLWLVGNHGIHTSVFPSAHVAGVVGAAMAVAYLIPTKRWIVSAYFVYAALVAVATVYGRYHYAVDAGGGLVLGAFAGPAGAWLFRLKTGGWLKHVARPRSRVRPLGS